MFVYIYIYGERERKRDSCQMRNIKLGIENTIIHK